VPAALPAGSEAGARTSTPLASRLVHLEVGDFTCVEPAALRFTFAAAVQGTWLDGSNSRIRHPCPCAPLPGLAPPFMPPSRIGLPLPLLPSAKEEISAAASLRICSVDTALRSVCSPQSFRFPSLSSR